MDIHIKKTRPTDKEAVISLLQAGNLLTDDLPQDLSDFLMAIDREKPVGIAGLERFGPVGLLRSVTVDPSYQGKQIASQLIGRLLEMAKAASLNEIYLITTTADLYFKQIGFQTVARQHVPLAIQQTAQFSSLCPSSAIVMKLVV